MTWLHLVGGVKEEEHPVPPVSFAAKAIIPAAAPKRKFATLSTPQFQANAGACNPHARSMALESEAKARTGAIVQLCRMDLYYGGRKLEKNGAETRDGGTYSSMLDNWIRMYGTVFESRKAYAPNEVTTWKPPASWNKDRAALNADLQPMAVTVESVVSELAQDRCVPFDHAVYLQMANNPANGLEKGPDGGTIQGYHARDFIGYDMDEVIPSYGIGCFYLINWWLGWGIGHPDRVTDNRFAAFTQSVSRLPFSVLTAGKFIGGASRIARGLRVEV